MSGGAIAGDLPPQIVDVEPLPRVASHPAKRAIADAGHARDLDERVVRLIGCVEHGTAREAGDSVARVIGEG